MRSRSPKNQLSARCICDERCFICGKRLVSRARAAISRVRTHSRVSSASPGFTLVELLIVIAIIAILVAVSVPVYFGYLDSVRNEVDKSNERDALSMAETEYLLASNSSGRFKTDEYFYYEVKGAQGRIVLLGRSDNWASELAKKLSNPTAQTAKDAGLRYGQCAHCLGATDGAPEKALSFLLVKVDPDGVAQIVWVASNTFPTSSDDPFAASNQFLHMNAK